MSAASRDSERLTTAVPASWPQAPWACAAVYGLGLSGLAAARLLRRHGVRVVGVDRRPAREIALGELAGDAGFELAVGADPAALPPGIEAVVVSPGVPADRPLLVAARAAGLPVLAEVELAFPLLSGPVVAITGSNGKSTTTAMTGALLAASGRAVELCGNIGVPLSSCVDGPPGRVFVTELSSFQLEAIVTFRPRAAALLNLSADHLDRHLDLARYAAAKRAIFRRQELDDVAVLNADDPLVAATAARARKRFFSRRGRVEDGCYLDGERVVEVEPGRADAELFRTADVPVPGPHNLENAMAAALLARAVGAEGGGVGAGLRRFRGLPHRLELVGEWGGVRWYDDSKGTNPGAVLMSLAGFADGSVHLILGGRSKGVDLAPLAPAVRRKAKQVYLIGEAAEELARALGDAAPRLRAGSMELAVDAAARSARRGEVVLLSPACASFDQYRDYAERGDDFQRLARRRTAALDAAARGAEGG